MPKKIETLGNGKYRFRIHLGYDSKGKQRVKTKTATAKNLKEAKIIYASLSKELSQIDPEKVENYTLDLFFDYWKEHYSQEHHELTTQKHYLNLYKRIKPLLGTKNLLDIQPFNILEVHKHLRKDKLSSNTIAKYHRFLHSLFSKAIQWNLVTSNPCSKVDTPRKSSSQKNLYDNENLKAFLKHMTEEPFKYQLMVYLGLLGGLRREEIFGLEWKHINWEKKFIQIEQVAPCLSGSPGFIKKPKTIQSKRIVSISDSLLNMLQVHLTAQETEAQLVGSKWIINNRIFTQWNGRPAHPCSFGTWMTKMYKKHNLPRISPHDLRHLSATHLVNLGIDIRTISGRLGHSRTSTTTDIYSHLIQSSESESAEKLDTFLKKVTNL